MKEVRASPGPQGRGEPPAPPGSRMPRAALGPAVVWPQTLSTDPWGYLCTAAAAAAAAAAAKSLQSCPTLCDPMDCSLLGVSVHGILQARTLEWVAISFSNA